MATVKVNKNSFLSFADLLEVTTGETFFDTPHFPEFLAADDDKIITLTQRYQGRLDLLSFDYYGTVDYWWVIAYINDIRQIPTELNIGRELRMPTATRIVDFLEKART